MLSVIPVHRLCRPGEYHSARRASEISRGLAKTLQFSVSTQTWENTGASGLGWCSKCATINIVLHFDDTALSCKPHDGSRVLSCRGVYAAPKNDQWTSELHLHVDYVCSVLSFLPMHMCEELTQIT